jgi:hypothetical protein
MFADLGTETGGKDFADQLPPNLLTDEIVPMGADEAKAKVQRIHDIDQVDMRQQGPGHMNGIELAA